MKYGYLAVEGPHDSAFVGRFLKFYGFSPIREIDGIKGTLFEELTIISYPVDGDLYKRIPVPTFYKNKDEMLIAVSCANSDDQLVNDITEMIESLLPENMKGIEEFAGIGIIADMDSPTSAEDRFDKFAAGFETLKIPRPNIAGKVTEGSPNTGIFILPDNSTEGTLEDILILCAEKAYPSILTPASELVETLNLNTKDFNKDDRKEFKKPAGKKKATINIISSILKPGKAIQVSIQDNRWICEKTRKIPQVSAFDQFIKNLFTL
ncbi:DUF3226 domain-containing protein [Desulfovibrio sp. JC010]|uniref:DUF3226 domain-containing protein n=1 Tax=Desulfovibrio sp. JC010 TaxID=2593641 RepID=UPI0013D765A1|nr:DUF3226 domain-containing protein [Desulfovibrio sp. JC010]NDV27422.1 hypothetical protein [Desulfovibrio sp. JC010]